MSIFGRLFGGSSADHDEDDVKAERTMICDSCGCEVDEEEIESGLCEECYSDYSGPTYCCGMIYEDGEDTCRSCGEPL